MPRPPVQYATSSCRALGAHIPPFRLFNSSSESVESARDKQVSNPALVLCAVNKLWRRIALSTPTIWTNITVDAEASHPSNPTSCHCEVKAGQLCNALFALENIGTRPWSLDLTISPTSAIATSPRLDLSLYDKIMSHPSTSHMRRFRMSTHSLISNVGSLTFPSVRFVTIELKDSTPVYHRDPATYIVPGLPALTHLILQSGSLPPSLPWDSLTHLYIGQQLYVVTCVALLQGCRRLERGIFWIIDEDGYTRVEPLKLIQDRVVESPVKDLSFIEDSPFDYSGVSAVLALPNLTTLRMWARPHGVHPFWHAYNTCLFSSLRRLNLVNVHGYMHCFEIVDCLRMCPLLSELALNVIPREGEDIGEVFRALSFSGQEPLLKYLRALQIHFQPMGAPPSPNQTAARSSPFDDLVEMISSRLPPPSGTLEESDGPIVRYLEQVAIRLEGDPGEQAVVPDRTLEKLKDLGCPNVNIDVRVVSKEYLRSPSLDFSLHWDEGFMDFVNEHPFLSFLSD
ncbi:hypothetical protein CC2G_007759 [Coprinopsis cinerea AmutBmut pab1-1]|nr:hypothetical protein CC2G_007759 [Coprinopsis cinerea AmutBmut pab1-1]